MKSMWVVNRLPWPVPVGKNLTILTQNKRTHDWTWLVSIDVFRSPICIFWDRLKDCMGRLATTCILLGILIHICIYVYICINLHQKRYLEKFLIYLMNWSIFFLYSVCVVIFGNLFGSASYYVDLFMLFVFLFFFRSFVAFNINIGDTVRQHTSNW